MSTFLADEVLLQWQEVAAQEILPPGVHFTDAGIRDTGVVDRLAVWLTGYVLSDQGGKTVTKGVAITRKVKPRWLPGFMWNRFKEEEKSATVSVEPKWIYPNATIKVPRLGEPVRIMVETSLESGWLAA